MGKDHIGNMHFNSDTYTDASTKALVACFSCLSLLGSFLIVASYIKWRDIRTTSRKLLVCISISDLLLSCGYLIGNFLSRKYQIVCTAQSFITSSASIMSFMWATFLGFYLHLTLVKNRETLAEKFIPVFHILGWMTGPVINVIAITKHMLGYPSNKINVAWCWIHSGDSRGKKWEVMWMLLDGKLWEMITMVLIVVFYFSVKIKIKKEVSRL